MPAHDRPPASDTPALVEDIYARTSIDPRAWCETSLIGLEYRQVDQLSDFVRGRHRRPDTADAAADEFVADLARPERSEILDRLHERLRKDLGFKRRQLGGDAHHLSCPAFDILTSVRVDPQRPRQVEFSMELCDIRQPEILTSDEFALGLAGEFSRVEVRHRGRIDVEQFIDDAEDHGVSIDYPRDASRATVTLPHLFSELLVCGQTLSFRALGPSREMPLIVSFMRAALELEAIGLSVLPRVRE